MDELRSLAGGAPVSPGSPRTAAKKTPVSAAESGGQAQASTELAALKTALDTASTAGSVLDQCFETVASASRPIDVFGALQKHTKIKTLAELKKIGKSDVSLMSKGEKWGMGTREHQELINELRRIN